MTSDPSNVALLIIIAAVLIILNGIVVLSNTAMESVSRNKIKQLANEGENKRVDVLIKILKNPSKHRYTNKMLNYIFVSAGLFTVLYLPEKRIISCIVFLIVAISLSEFFPRKIARQHGDSLALVFAGIQNGVCVFLSPIVGIFMLIANIFLKIFRQDIDVDEKGFSEDDVMSMLEVGQETGEIKEEGKKMINSIFAFDDELAYEIMTPRTEVFIIDINDPTEEFIDQLMELRYSRIPVCEDETDNIIGILHIKDYLIKARESGFDKVDIRAILRKPTFVPETKNIDSLFFELQKEKQHIAILIDEYGGFSGIVTMEDIIEEVMGDIDDEYDQEEHIISKIDDNNYYVDGNVSLNELNEELNINLESDNSETIGGFLIDILGEIPVDGDFDRTVEYENYVFNILSVKERRIEKIKLFIGQKENEEELS